MSGVAVRRGRVLGGVGVVVLVGLVVLAAGGVQGPTEPSAPVRSAPTASAGSTTVDPGQRRLAIHPGSLPAPNAGTNTLAVW